MIRIQFHQFAAVLLFLPVACQEQEEQQEEVVGRNSPRPEDIGCNMPGPYGLDADSLEANRPPLKEENQIDDYADYLSWFHVYETLEQAVDSGQPACLYYEVLDVKNGYARVGSPEPVTGEFKVWKMDNGNDLVATGYTQCCDYCKYDPFFNDLGIVRSRCGEECTQDLVFYEIEHGVELEEDKVYLPLTEIEAHEEIIRQRVVDEYALADTRSELKFILPQKGTTMDVEISMDGNAIEFVIAQLEWDGSSFNVSRTYDEIPRKD